MQNNFIQISSSPSNLIQKILDYDNIMDTTGVFKWKEHPSQVVIKSQNFYYKIYEEPLSNGWFNHIIRKTLSDIYNEYGIDWQICTYNDGNIITTIEKREPISVCDNNVDGEDIILGWNETLYELENRLNLNVVLKQIRKYIPEVNYLKLLREAYFTADDWGVYNGKIILLDDADFSLFLGDANKDIIYHRADIINCLYPNYGECIFSGIDTFSSIIKDNIITEKGIEHNSGVTGKWWLYNITHNNGNKIKNQILSYKENYLNNCLKLSIDNKKLIGGFKRVNV